MRKGKRLLAMSVAVAMAGALSGCGVNVSTKEEAAASTEASKTESSAEAGTETQSGGTSGEPITLKVIDWSDSTKARREEFHKKFMEENPDITIEYTDFTA
ncbi:MAG: sugar ABC transporter substrate-binding protein, partial [Hungatella sp.]